MALAPSQLDPLDAAQPGWQWMRALRFLPVAEEWTGDGVHFSIVGGGAQLDHVEYRSRYVTGKDADHAGGDGTPGFEAAPGEVASSHALGVIGAARDGAGVSGGAPDARMSVLRVDLRQDNYGTQLRKSFENALAFDSDIALGAYEFAELFFDGTSSAALSPAWAAIEDWAKNGRDGKGGLFVTAASTHDQGFGLANLHHTKNSPYAIAVGAFGEDGGHDAATATGDNVLVSGYGHYVAATAEGNRYELTRDADIPAAQIGALTALMLEANPNLGNRDVMEILAYSARRAPEAHEGADVSGVDLSGYEVNGAERWNGGGATFDPRFGFGVADAHAATRMAETWLGPGNAAREDSYVNHVTAVARFGAWSLPDGGQRDAARWIDRSIEVDKAALVIDIAHQDWRDLEISLISPAGTRALLFDGSAIDWSRVDAPQPTGLLDWDFGSNRFWGEDSRGLWTVEIKDDSADGDVGSLRNWTLILWGDENAPRRWVYTDEYSEMADVLRETVFAGGDAGGDIIDASAVTTASRIDLNPNVTGEIDGRRVKVASGSKFEGAIGGDASDRITGNRLDNWLHGGRGDDLIIGRDGANVIEGGRGRDNLVGGLGQDFFTFRDIQRDGWDRVNAFQDGIDKIDLRDSLAGLEPIGGDWSNHIKTVQRGDNVNLFVDFDGDADGFFSDDVLVALVRDIDVSQLTIGEDILVA